MPFNGGKIGVLNQPSTVTAEGYYGMKDHLLYVNASKMVGYGAKAEGGTEADLDVSGTTYRVHKFTTSGTFTVNQTISNVQFLIQAGGAGGAGWSGGGGGAGGLRASVSGNNSGGGASAESELTLNSGTYTITVGAGGTAGAGANNSAGQGANGSN